MNLITGDTVPDLYIEAWWNMRVSHVKEDSRNGPVATFQEPTVLTLYNPEKRVLFDWDRDANPFFHVMETVWMFAGSNDSGFPSKFNSTYAKYAEADGLVHGAYGKRWRDHFQPKELGPRFKMDQIQLAIAMLKRNAEDRRVVLSMWDTAEDLGASKNDLPCNTHIYFRVVQGRLNMTVCNRSNDMVWGALGANVVHMTYLQELVARGAGYKIGTYRVFTNNLHVYTDRPDIKKIWETSVPYDPYLNKVTPYPLLQPGETAEELFHDCEDMVKKDFSTTFRTAWMNDVALPMHQAYLDKANREQWIENIAAQDWSLACQEWVARRKEEVSLNPSQTQSQGS